MLNKNTKGHSQLILIGNRNLTASDSACCGSEEVVATSSDWKGSDNKLD
jgi:hypothetical protein